MPSTKKSPEEPTKSRPHIPDYGIPKASKGMLPWRHVRERMEKALIYWIGTTDPQGRPHAAPVWGMWLHDRFYFGGSPKTRRSRNLAENQAVVVHLESGSEVVILQGSARPLRGLDPALKAEMAVASKAKYGQAGSPDDMGEEGAYVVAPRVVFAWTQFPKDATRWRFEDGR
jgi:nitroimidazol reductase NimA-like FMN-containing flavoprotein (pyridoxamine 5'-phosphate oxidase superfamily)